MVKITFIDVAGTARTVEGEVGATVMETAINNGVPGIEAECGGACACSTCHVYIEEEWREKVGEPSPIEEDMLDFAFAVQPNSRRPSRALPKVSSSAYSRSTPTGNPLAIRVTFNGRCFSRLAR